MPLFPLDRRRFLLTGAAVCLSRPVAVAQPKDDAAKARKGTPFHSPDGADCIGGVAFSADRRLVALFQDDRIRLWETDTGRWAGTLGGHRFDAADLFAVVDAGKGVIAWSGRGKGACLAWDLRTGAAREVFAKAGGAGNPDSVGAASADGRRVATTHWGSQGKSVVRGWDAATGKDLWVFDNADGKKAVYGLAFSPDGKALAAAGEDGKVRLIDTATGKESAVLDGGKGWAVDVEWSGDGKWVAALYPGVRAVANVVVWNAVTGKPAGTVGPLTVPDHAHLSPDGRHLVAVRAAAAAVWEVPGEKPVAELKISGHRGCAWSADGKSLLFVREYPRTIELLTFDLADLLPKK
jgi:hypothetical protein